MIEGEVNPALEGTIQLHVVGPEGTLDISPWIDTGYNGFLTLRDEQINRLGLKWFRTCETTLGDGSACMVDEYVGEVVWEDARRRIFVDRSDIRPLIGTALLAGYKLEMEFQADGALWLNPLDS